MHSEGHILHCPVCSIELANIHAHSSHLRKVHPSFDKFFCKLCGEKFYSAKKLSNHKRKNHSEDCVQCQICNLQFEADKGLYLHMAKVHKSEWKTVKHSKKVCKF